VVIACSDAAKLKQQARQAGKQEGQAQYAVIVAKAEEEARAMITQAQEEAETLQRKGLARMEVAVHEAVAYVIGQAPEGENG
jgi:flagellar biosynthesis/type III secretory pathway protein FliH